MNILKIKLCFQTGTSLRRDIQTLELERQSIFSQYTTANGIGLTSPQVSNPSTETAGQTGRTFGEFSLNQLTSQHDVIDLTGGADLPTPGSFWKGEIIFSKVIITGFDYNFNFLTAVHVKLTIFSVIHSCRWWCRPAAKSGDPSSRSERNFLRNKKYSSRSAKTTRKANYYRCQYFLYVFCLIISNWTSYTSPAAISSPYFVNIVISILCFLHFFILISATTEHGHEESNPPPRWTPTCLSDYGPLRAGSARTTPIGNKRTLWFPV